MFGIRKIGGTKRGVAVFSDLYYFAEYPNLDSNIYMLVAGDVDGSGDYELMLIDAGNGLNSESLIAGIRKAGFDPRKITAITLTHEHLDHVFGIYNIPELVGINPKILALGDTYRAVKNADTSILAPRMLGIRPSLFGVDIHPMDAVELEEGDTLSFGNFNFRVLFTPGHSNGSMCLYEPDRKLLFSGDVVFIGGSFGRYDFPGGSLSKLTASIKRLSELDVDCLFPGHMGFSKEGSVEIRKALMMISMF